MRTLIVTVWLLFLWLGFAYLYVTVLAPADPFQRKRNEGGEDSQEQFSEHV